MITAPSLNVSTALPMLQTTPTFLQAANAMTGTTPFIITPRLQQLTGVTSSVAAMLSSTAPPGLMTTPVAAAAVEPVNPSPAGVLYYSDPYIQRMFEYSSLEPSAAGMCLCCFLLFCQFHIFLHCQ